METPILLALHGLPGVGKDTTYEFIKDWCAASDPALSAVRRGFADKPKLAFARQFFPTITQDEAIKWVDKFKNSINADFKYPTQWIVDEQVFEYDCITMRDMLNQFATESAREVYGEDHWVDMLLPQTKWAHSFEMSYADQGPGAHTSIVKLPDFGVITDLRADNEIARINLLPSAVKIKIKRKDREEEVRASYEAKGIEPHLFARELPDEDFDIILVNDDNNLVNSRSRVSIMMHVLRLYSPGWLRDHAKTHGPRYIT